MKHGEGREEARELYVHCQMTFEEIGQRVGRSEKTIRTWAEEDGWKKERGEFLETRKNVHSKLYQVINKIADRIVTDTDANQDLSPQMLHALGNLVDKMDKLYKYESKPTEKPADESKQVSPDELAAKVAEVMGA